MAVVGYIDQWNINGEEYDIHDKDRGIPNGVATLDENGRIPYSQLPESAIELKGYWDASTNTPALVDGSGTNGDEYFVSVEGTQDLGSGSQFFAVGDRVLYLEGIWKNIDSGSVRTVNSISPNVQGNIELVLGGSNIPVKKGFLGSVFSDKLGTYWKRYSVTLSPGGQRPRLYQVVYAKGLYVAATNYGIVYSYNGVTWLSSSTGTSLSALSIKYANNLFVAGADNGLWWSEDGITWTESLSSGSFRKLYRFGSQWFALGSNKIYTSTTGKTWTQVSGSSAFSSANFRDMSYDYYNSKYIAVGSAGIWKSSNGSSWTQVSGDTSTIDFLSVLHGDSIWVATSSSTLYWSEDGNTWTRTQAVIHGGPLCHRKGMWIMGSYSTYGVQYSVDGKSWSTSTLNTGNTQSLLYANGKFFAANGPSSGYGGVFSSVDGNNWTRIDGITQSGSSNFNFLSYVYGILFVTDLTSLSQPQTWISSITELIENGEVDLGDTPIV